MGFQCFHLRLSSDLIVKNVSIIVNTRQSGRMKEKTLGGMSMKKVTRIIMFAFFLSLSLATCAKEEYKDSNFLLTYDKEEYTVEKTSDGVIKVQAINMPDDNGGHNTVLACFYQSNTEFSRIGELTGEDLVDFEKTFTYSMCRGLFDVDNGVAVIADGYSLNGEACEYFMILSDGTECYVTEYNYGETIYYVACRLCPYTSELNDEYRSIYSTIKLNADQEEKINKEQDPEYSDLLIEQQSLQAEYDKLLSEHKELQIEHESLLQNLENKEEKDSIEVETDKHETEIDIEVILQQELSGVEKNSSAALDKIAMLAKEDAKTVTEEQINEAIAAIRNNYPQYYNGAECMEKYLYYGYLLDYSFDDSDPRSELGTDTYQAIKYVYRNAETVLDPSTKSNLEQIKKDLQKIK